MSTIAMDTPATRTSHSIEWAPFRLADGIDETTLLTASEALQREFISQQRGFIRRELLKGQANQWFDPVGFATTITTQLGPLSFGARNTLIRDTLWAYLPKDFPQAMQILLDSLGPQIPHCEVTGFDGFIVMSQNDFVVKYGLDYFDISMQALYEMTKRFTAEGAIRAFIQRYPEQTLALLRRHCVIVSSCQPSGRFKVLAQYHASDVESAPPRAAALAWRVSRPVAPVAPGRRQMPGAVAGRYGRAVRRLA
jgi:hypothetical protein